MSAAQNPPRAPSTERITKTAPIVHLATIYCLSERSQRTWFQKDSHNPLTALLSAVVDLPRQYAAVKNVLGELKGRLSVEEWQQIAGHEATLNHPRSGNWIIMDGGVGAGLWYDSCFFFDFRYTAACVDMCMVVLTGLRRRHWE